MSNDSTDRGLDVLVARVSKELDVERVQIMDPGVTVGHAEQGPLLNNPRIL